MKNERWYQDLSSRNASGDYAGIIFAILECYLKEVSSPLQYMYINYCLAMACIGVGNTAAGISFLKLLLKQSKESSLDSAGEIFVSRVHLQLALVEGFSHYEPIFFKNDHFAAAASILDYAQQINDQVLAAASAIVMNQWHRVDAAEGVCYLPRSPKMLQIEPTNLCNLRCTMCPREKMTRATGFMDVELFREIFNNWSNKHVTLPLEHLVFGNVINVIRKGLVKLYFMGEPLLHKSLPQMIEIAKEEGCFLGVQTNGFLLSDEIICERLLKAKPSEIGFSIDGMNISTYEKVRQGASYQVILDNMKNLYYARERLGLSKEISIFISTLIDDSSEDAKQKAGAFLQPMAQFADSIGHTPLDRKREPVFFDSDGKMKLMENRQNCQNVLSCGEPLEKLNVLWNGDITPCCHDIDGLLKLGHVEDGIDRVWLSEQTIKLQSAILHKDYAKFSLCRECQKIL